MEERPNVIRLSDRERNKKISMVSGVGVGANIMLSVIKATAGV